MSSARHFVVTVIVFALVTCGRLGYQSPVDYARAEA